jgi:gluconate 2-dehydrogenase gamma chain
MDSDLSRRGFFKLVGAVGTAAALPGTVLAQGGAGATMAQQAPMHLFFTASEAAFITAAVDRLIPADEQWPSASQAGVVTFIDRQLAGAYGNGERLYLSGPWRAGTPQQGYQLPLTPAQLYRIAIAAAEPAIEKRFGRRFVELSANQQDAALKALETGDIQFDQLPPPVFFETLLANTIEGFFADPVYGGNRDMAGWRMVGFPGAYASFILEVDQHGMRYTRPPIGMGHTAEGTNPG